MLCCVSSLGWQVVEGSTEGVDVDLIVHELEEVVVRAGAELLAPGRSRRVGPGLRFAFEQDFLEIGFCVVLRRAAAMTRKREVVSFAIASCLPCL